MARSARPRARTINGSARPAQRWLTNSAARLTAPLRVLLKRTQRASAHAASDLVKTGQSTIGAPLNWLAGQVKTAPDDQDKAMAAVRSGEIVPLASVLKTVEKSVPGDVLNVALVARRRRNVELHDHRADAARLLPRRQRRRRQQQRHVDQASLMRALVVEDEAQIAAEICAHLTQAGYVVETCADGEEAWSRAGTEDFDGIILDLGLPRLDGLSVVRQLRAAGVTTPILVLTARGTWTERVAGIDAGADDYLPKPFQPEELVARLGAIIRRSTGHTTPTLEAGPLRVDTRRMITTVNGAPVSLSLLEFRALRYLIHNKGRPVSQFELGEHVYGADQEPGSNALEVLIARLRKKIGGELIETQRGYGYLIRG